MKIVKAGYEIMPRDEERGGLAIIERAARVCYKTEGAICEGSAEKMARMLIRRRHDAMLEHGDYIFMLDDYHILDNVADGLRMLMYKTGRSPMLKLTNLDGRSVISGNIRAWRELIQSGSAAAYYFTGAIDPIWTEDLIPEAERIVDPRVKRIRYEDLIGEVERRTHLRQTVRFIVDRGVSHEFVRHRVMSFAQESTRWNNYSDDRFGTEITVIEPCFLAPHTEPYDLWVRQCMGAEVGYFTEMNLGLMPQEARAVLLNSTKTELVMTGTLGDWQHFFDLRALEKTGRAHPQAVEVAKPLLIEMVNRFPGVIVID